MIALEPITMSFADILRHEAANDGVAAIKTTDGDYLPVRSIEPGPDWALVHVDYGENERRLLIRYAAIASVTLR